MSIQKVFRGWRFQSWSLITVFWYLWHIWKPSGFEKSMWASFLKTALCSITENLSEDCFLSLLFFYMHLWSGEKSKIIVSLVRVRIDEQFTSWKFNLMVPSSSKMFLLAKLVTFVWISFTLFLWFFFYGKVSLISLFYSMNIVMSVSLLLKNTYMHILWSKMFYSMCEITGKY